MRTTLRDPGHAEVEVAASKNSVMLSSDGSRVRLSERQARMLHTFLHRAFPSGNQIKRELGLLSDMPTMDREAEQRAKLRGSVFSQFIIALHGLVKLEKDKPLEDWDPWVREVVGWAVPIFYDLRDKGEVFFADHPMPDSLLTSAPVRH